MSNGNGSKLTTRKFLLTASVLFGVFVALFMGKLTGGEAVILIPAILVIFVGGNVTAKHKAFVEGS